MIRAGRLRNRLELQTDTATVDEYGDKSPSAWLTTQTVWAAIEPLRGRELFAAQQVKSDVTHKITMRHQPGITSAMRFKEGSRAFNIAAPPINVRERDRMIEVLCVEVEGEVA